MSVVGLSMEGAQGISGALNALSQSVEQLAARQAANTRATVAGARASRDVAAANVAATSSVQALATATQTTASRIQGVAGAVQGLVSQLGSENRTAGLVASMAGTTAQFASMGAMLGPGGALIGGLLGFASAAASAIGTTEGLSEAAARLRGEVEGAAEALSRFETTRREGSLERAAAGYAGIEARLSGVAAETEREARIAARIAEEGLFGGEAADRRASLLLDEMMAEAGGGASARRGGGGSRRGTPEAPVDESAFADSTFAMAEAEAARREAVNMAAEAEATREAAERARAEDAADWEAWAERRREAQEAAAEASREWAEHERELLEETKSAHQDFATGYVSSIGEVIASWEALADASRASGSTMLSTGRLMERGVTAIANNIAESVGGTMTSAFSSAVGAWLDGSKSFVEAAEEMAKGVIKALVQESIVQGVTELARGIADLASYRYDSAALHFAAAAAWAVVGGAAGAIGAATGAFGGGGKAEGASQREMADRDRERARDAPTGNAVINIYADGMPVTRADFAAGMSRALRDTVRAGYLPAGALGR